MNDAFSDGLRNVKSPRGYVGGFWILNCANMDEAVAWAGKLASPGGRPSRSVPSSKCHPSNGNIFATL
jgi:hypothetical protein